MLDDEQPGTTPTEGDSTAAPTKPARKRAPRKAAVPPPVDAGPGGDPDDAAGPPAEAAAPVKRVRVRKATMGTPPAAATPPAADAAPDAAPAAPAADAPAGAPTKRTRSRKAVPVVPSAEAEATPPSRVRRAAAAPPAITFQPPPEIVVDPLAEEELDADSPAPARRAPRITPDAGDAPEGRARQPRQRTPRVVAAEPTSDDAASEESDAPGDDQGEGDGERTGSRRRRGRRGRGRGRGTGEGGEAAEGDADAPAEGEAESTDSGPSDEESDGEGGTRRRRRRRRGAGAGEEPGPDDPPRTVVRVREPRAPREPREPREGGGGRQQTSEPGIRGVQGSTRLEAKRQRRRDGRDAGRRPSIVSESEFLARREAVERVMLVRQSDERTQIAVLEDSILVEHYVAQAEATTYTGNVYLGRVQNVLASMEAAFVDIGKGRNAVLYAGEVNYDASALEGRPPRIEQALKSGQQIVVQVTKDPLGHKGARLTSQVSLPGRYMVFVPEQSMTGISRKLPDTERARLKGILKTIKPEGAGIIIRTAAEGASEEDLTADLRRLQAQWEVIEAKSKKETGPAPLYEEPDLVLRVVRDLFNEDFGALVVEGERDYQTIHDYLEHLAPDLLPKLQSYDAASGGQGVFVDYRVEEQIHKALERKVSLPSGGSLVIDRTEAMTVVDVNTGKFTGKGGNLEETVTRNNLEAAEEVVRQLRLRDIGGIIVIDFIDMILESNRELVARRLKECLGRDRTKHQVAEITSLGLLQMTRKRIGAGLHEIFTETCPECSGRGVKITMEPPTKVKKGSRVPSPLAMAKVVRPPRPAADDSTTDPTEPTGPTEPTEATGPTEPPEPTGEDEVSLDAAPVDTTPADVEATATPEPAEALEPAGSEAPSEPDAPSEPAAADSPPGSEPSAESEPPAAPDAADDTPDEWRFAAATD